MYCRERAVYPATLASYAQEMEHDGRKYSVTLNEQLTDYLRISIFTLSRWDTGAQIRQRGMDALMRVFFQSKEARAILGVPTLTETNGVSSAVVAEPINSVT
jgi:hypothetical protein